MQAFNLRRSALRLLLPALAWIFCACAPAPVPADAPPTAWLRVQVSPALMVFSGTFSACTPEGVGLAIQQAPGAAFAPEQADLTLAWGDNPAAQPGYAAELAREELVLVANPANPVQSLELSALQAAYSGQLTAFDWDYLGQAPLPLVLYLYPRGSGLQTILDPTLFPEGPAPAREVVTAPAPAEMRQSVAAEPGALGFLPRRWVDSSVKTVRVAGLPSGAWERPILALSSVEPQGPARDWLLCVQAGMQ